jgi:hypothetical protein
VENCGTAWQATDDNMAHAHCMITTATHTYSDYVIIFAFSRQPCLPERALVLGLYLHSLSC